MILLLQSTINWPWWISLIAAVAGMAAGIAAGLPWKSIAAARKEALEDERAKGIEKDKRIIQLEARIVQLEANIKVLEAKTDLNGLREQVGAEMRALKVQFAKHTDQDLATANQQSEATKQVHSALAAVETTLKLLQERQ